MKAFESTFPKDYRKYEIRKILSLILAGKFTQVISVPGGGKATVLKLLAVNTKLRKSHLGNDETSISFLYLNLLELGDFDQVQLEKYLLLALDEKAKPASDHLMLLKQLNKIVAKKLDTTSIVLMFDHFDEFQNHLPKSFFQMLRGFKELKKYKFTCVFATRRDLRELIDFEIVKEFYDFFLDNTVYLQLNDKVATDFLFSQIEKLFSKKLDEENRQSILSQTSGHTKLTKVISELVLQEGIDTDPDTLLSKSIIRAALFELWLFLTAQEQHNLKLIAKQTPPENETALESLVKFGLVGIDHKFTIPLFEKFVKETVPAYSQEKISYNQASKEIQKGTNVISDLLSPQEYRLLLFLIENQDRIIDRTELIGAVWPSAQVAEGISDEAIDQMIFRLRKKVEDEPNSPKHITTVKGQGIRFTP